MPGVVTLPFLLTSLLVITVPGPDLALMTRVVIAQGRRAGAQVAFGMIAGGATQVGLGLAGVGALLAGSEGARSAVQVVGSLVLAGYGVLGALSTRAGKPGSGDAAPGPAAPGSARLPMLGNALAGYTTTLTNAKVGLFLWAFLPPFVPSGTPFLAGVLVLAAVHLTTALTWLLLWAYIGGAALARLPDAWTRRLDLGTSVLLVAAGTAMFLHALSG
jgi:threonine/homoserine/homoserine lactone efflux protein